MTWIPRRSRQQIRTDLSSLRLRPILMQRSQCVAAQRMKEGHWFGCLPIPLQSVMSGRCDAMTRWICIYLNDHGFPCFRVT